MSPAALFLEFNSNAGRSIDGLMVVRFLHNFKPAVPVAPVDTSVHKSDKMANNAPAITAAQNKHF